MSDYMVKYNNISDKAVGCHAQTRPSIPAPVRDVQVVNIPGRDASFYESEGNYSDIVIPITFYFSDRNPNNWGSLYRKVKHWILSESEGELRFSDDEDIFYKVLSTSIKTSARLSKRIGAVTAEFVCEGYTYMNSGDAFISLAASIENEYDLCHPIYRIQGSGRCVLTVNGNEFVVEVNSGTTIDTDKFIAYNINSGTFANTTVTGDYQGLWLKPGINTMSITSGFTCTFMPQWRCL